MDYLDCILSLYNAEQASLLLGPQRYDGAPQLTPELHQTLKQFAEDAQQYGQKLFDALFPPGSSLDTGLRSALNHAEGKKLRFRLDIPETAPAELHQLNWELLYNQNAPTGGEFLTRSADISFSRQRNVSGRPPLDTDRTQIKLLVVISCPNNLDPDKYQPLKRAEIEARFRGWLEPLRIKTRLSSYDFLPAPVTRNAIYQKLAAGDYQAVQFYGHGYKVEGTSETGLVLEKEDGSADFAKEENCLPIFRAATPQSLVSLMACHSGAASRATDAFSGLALGLVRQNHQAVIAMKKAVKIETAEAFLKYFYQGLLNTDGVNDAAFNQAQAQLALADDDEWFLPTLYMRTPNGRLWVEGPQIVAGRAIQQVSGLSEQILRYFRKGKVVPIVGPGIWKGDAQKGIPDLFPTPAETATFLAQTLHNEPHFPVPDHPYQNNDLPRIARLYGIAKESEYAPHEDVVSLYRDELCKRLGLKNPGLAQQSLSKVINALAGERFNQDPAEPHKLLARLTRLGCKTFITTNCDSFLYEALLQEARANGNSVEPRLRCYWYTMGETGDYPATTPDNPFVFHLYGFDEEPASLVLTEDNYLEFMRSLAQDWNQNLTASVKPRIPTYVQSALSSSMLLFLGFDLSSLDFRVLFRGLVERFEPKAIDPKRLAVIQVDEETPVAELNKFITRDASKLEITPYGGSTRDYLTALCAALELN